MKICICYPRSILIFLIILFLLLNFLFFFKYLFEGDSITKRKKKQVSESEFLKTYVDFNHTSFENKGIVHFYFPALRAENFYTNKFYNETFNSNFSSKEPICEYYYDIDTNNVIDSNGDACLDDNFNMETKCCMKKEEILNNCEELNCCENKYLCIYNCLKSNFTQIQHNANSHFKYCKQDCKITNKSYQTNKFCYKFC